MYTCKNPIECRTFIPILIHFMKFVLIQMKVESINWMQSQVH
jgi:hypothetical protein